MRTISFSDQFRVRINQNQICSIMWIVFLIISQLFLRQEMRMLLLHRATNENNRVSEKNIA